MALRGGGFKGNEGVSSSFAPRASCFLLPVGGIRRHKTQVRCLFIPPSPFRLGREKALFAVVQLISNCIITITMIVSGLVSRTKAFLLLLLLLLFLFLFNHTCNLALIWPRRSFRFFNVFKFILLVRAVPCDRREFEGKKTALHLGTFARAAHYAWPRAF